jgi:hypothetical protein
MLPPMPLNVPALLPPVLVPPVLIPPELVPPVLVPPVLIPPELVPPVLAPPVLIPPELVPPELVPPELLPPTLAVPAALLLPALAPPLLSEPPLPGLVVLDSPPHATSDVAPTKLAPKANVAARPSRDRGSTGGAKCASASSTEQNGHAASVCRTWRAQRGQGTR